MEKKRLLISWIALHGDFHFDPEKKERETNPDGPNPVLHRFFPENRYNKHIILYTNREESEYCFLKLRGWLIRNNRHPYAFEKVDIGEKDLIEVIEIKSKIEPILLEHEEYQIDLYATPGTKAMHTAWHLVHLDDRFDTRLIQIREARHTDGKNPQLLEIEFGASDIPGNLIAWQKRIDKDEIAEGRFIPKKLEEPYRLGKLAAAAGKVGILVLGNSGVGKGVLVNYIQKNSPRADKPFKAINCSALTDELLHSELFGFEQGAFTGAEERYEGLFIQCDGGTLFLDEIGDTSPKMQQSLLRVLQECKVRPIKGMETDVDVRIIAATNKNLRNECEEGRFRWDLYYRLAVAEISLPDLVEWGPKDIGIKLDEFLENVGRELKKPNTLKLTRPLRTFLLNYSYPGNVREMENLVYWLYVVAEDGKASKDHLRRDILIQKERCPLLLEEVELRHIEKILELKGGNKTHARIALGISEGKLKSKLDKIEERKNAGGGKP